MTTATLSTKLGLADGALACLLHAPKALADQLAGAGAAVSTRLAGEPPFMLSFHESLAELDQRFPVLKRHLPPGGKLWIAWPKAGQRGTDLSLTKIIKVGYDHGLVESKTIALDATWSAIKFTHPRAGKQYQNSYGQLPPG